MTKARRITAVAAASMVIAAGLVGVATPAQAATLTIDCAADTVAGGDVVYTIVAAPGPRGPGPRPPHRPAGSAHGSASHCRWAPVPGGEH